jgi:hypothetical protein
MTVRGEGHNGSTGLTSWAGGAGAATPLHKRPETAADLGEPSRVPEKSALEKSLTSGRSEGELVVSDLAIIEDTETKLAGDPGYMALVDEATDCSRQANLPCRC